MPKRKKPVKIVVPNPEPGDVVLMRDWLGESLEVKVKYIGYSLTYGDTVEGTVVEHTQKGRAVGGKHVALPLSHKIDSARAHSERRGKWTIELPDGTTEEVRSKRAAQELCEERGVVFQQV